MLKFIKSLFNQTKIEAPKTLSYEERFFKCMVDLNKAFKIMEENDMEDVFSINIKLMIRNGKRLVKVYGVVKQVEDLTADYVIRIEKDYLTIVETTNSQLKSLAKTKKLGSITYRELQDRGLL